MRSYVVTSSQAAERMAGLGGTRALITGAWACDEFRLAASLVS